MTTCTAEDGPDRARDTDGHSVGDGGDPGGGPGHRPAGAGRASRARCCCAVPSSSWATATRPRPSGPSAAGGSPPGTSAMLDAEGWLTIVGRLQGRDHPGGREHRLRRGRAGARAAPRGPPGGGGRLPRRAGGGAGGGLRRGGRRGSTWKSAGDGSPPRAWPGSRPPSWWCTSTRSRCSGIGKPDRPASAGPRGPTRLRRPGETLRRQTVEKREGVS